MPCAWTNLVWDTAVPTRPRDQKEILFSIRMRGNKLFTCNPGLQPLFRVFPTFWVGVRKALADRHQTSQPIDPMSISHPTDQELLCDYPRHISTTLGSSLIMLRAKSNALTRYGRCYTTDRNNILSRVRRPTPRSKQFFFFPESCILIFCIIINFFLVCGFILVCILH